MPDGDIFQRKLAGAGKGWVRVFRLLNQDPNRSDIGPEILTAARCNLDQLPRNYVIEALGYLGDAFHSEILARESGSGNGSAQAFLRLDARLRLLDYGDAFATAQLVADSIRSVFNTSRMRGDNLSVEAIIARFSSTFQNKLLDSRLSRLRPELQQAHGRSNSEQDAWERSVKTQPENGMTRMIQNYINSGGVRFRVPPRRRRPAPSLAQLLTRPIRLADR